MRYLLLAAGIIFSCLSAKSQNVLVKAESDLSTSDFTNASNPIVVSSVNGQTYFPQEYAHLISGSPFFMDRPMKAVLLDEENKVYSSNAVRMDLLNNRVIYKDPASGQEMVASLPLVEVQLTDTVQNKKYIFLRGQRIPQSKLIVANTWFQVLVNDKVSLCREMRKMAHQTIIYGQPEKQANIVTDEYYYVLIDENFSRINGWKGLLETLGDKRDLLDKYIQDHHLKGKSADDFTQLVQYYNAIKG
jgi:hypothetical protein